MKPFSGIISMGLMLGSLGCSSTLIPSRAADRDDLSELKRRVIELQEQAAVIQVELDRVRRELAQLRDKHVPASDPSLEGEKPSGVSMLGDLNRGNPKDSGLATSGKKNTLESSDLAPPRIEPRATMEGAPSEAEDVLQYEASLEPVLNDGADAEKAESEPVSPEAQLLYDRGYTLYHQQRYIDAESGFRRFLQIHPRNELADNAQYWIGECRYARGDIRGALAAFQETVERYPDGNKVPDAILKIAGCLEELGASEAAQARYDEVMRRFPNSAAAVLAEERRQRSN